MPITQLKTMSASPESLGDSASPGSAVQASTVPIEAGPDDNRAVLYSLLESFLILNPKPSDEHMHMLARSVNMDPAELESFLYEMFSQLLDADKTQPVLSDIDMPDIEGDDSLDEPAEFEDEGTQASALSARIEATAMPTAINAADKAIMRRLFNLNDIDDSATAAVTASDADGRAAKNDGVVDLETTDNPDPLKEAADSDGAVDEEVVDDQYDIGLQQP